MNYIRGIKVSLQVAAYFYFFNEIYDTPLKGIFYDIIRKPGIRQKNSKNKKESIDEFHVRLRDWYHQPDNNAFHMEGPDLPGLSKKNVENTLIQVGKRIILNGEDEDKYIQNFNFCLMYGGCKFFDLCHGDRKVAMKLFKNKKEKEVVVI